MEELKPQRIDVLEVELCPKNPGFEIEWMSYFLGG